jgi:tetratricopeptide (TPR) repeat protein
VILAFGCSHGSGDASASAHSKLYPDLPPIASLNDANGFFSTAEKTASLVSQPADKATLLSEIAKARLNAGDAASAKQTAAQLAQYASTLSSSDTNTTEIVLPILAQTQAMVGDVAGAENTAASIKEPVGQSDAWERIVATQAEQGDIKGAVLAVSKAKFTVAAHQYAALSAIAMEAAIHGDEHGSEIVSRHVESHWRPKVYADAANGLQQRGNTAAAQTMIQEAIKAVEEIHDKLPTYENANRVASLISIAKVQVTWGDQAGARQTLRRAIPFAGKIGLDSDKSWELRNDIIGQLVSTLLQAGDNNTAQMVASTIKDPTIRAAYVDSARTGKPIITPDMENASGAPIESPIVAEARKGDLEGAKKSLEDVLDPAQRAMILTQIGETFHRSAGK